MGVAQEIVLITFGLRLGTLSVAGALAFGLGSNDIEPENCRDGLINGAVNTSV